MLQTFYDLNGVEYHQDVVKLEKNEFSGKEVSFFRVKNYKKEYSIYVKRSMKILLAQMKISKITILTSEKGMSSYKIL
jgi:hypothetical protein